MQVSCKRRGWHKNNTANNAVFLTDHRTWSRPGQLFGDALAMEMHREPEEPSYAVPFFLNEIRTRTFVCLYAHDKVLSAILDRLPRIPRHYCSRKLPLDVNDDRLLSGGSPLEEILCGPDAEGWDGEGYRPVDLLRARYILATLREDILNVRLGNPTGDSVGFIRRVAQPFKRCRNPTLTPF